MNKLPDGWSNTTLGKIAIISAGGTPSRSRSEYWNGDIPWITTSAINFGTINEADEHITVEGLANSSAKLLPHGTLLMAMYGQGMTRGRVGILGISAATNQACAAIRVSGDCNDQFVYHALQYQYYSIRELGHGGNQKNLNQSLIEGIPIALPPLPEQRKIAEILGTWDAAIGRVEQLIAALQRRKQGLVQRLLTGAVRFPEFVGTEWEECCIGDLLTEAKRPLRLEPDKDYSLASVRRRSEGLFFREQRPGRELTSSEMYEVQTGDFLISKRQIVHGASALVTSEFDGFLVSNSYHVLSARDRMDIRYFNWLSKTPLLYHYSYVASHGVHIEKLFFVLETYLQQRVVVPNSIDEQQKIAAVLDSADRQIQKYQLYLAQLQAQKKGLMQRLLTGQVRVKVA